MDVAGKRTKATHTLNLKTAISRDNSAVVIVGVWKRLLNPFTRYVGLFSRHGEEQDSIRVIRVHFIVIVRAI